jgi:hypothetical protein
MTCKCGGRVDVVRYHAVGGICEHYAKLACECGKSTGFVKVCRNTGRWLIAAFKSL